MASSLEGTRAVRLPSISGRMAAAIVGPRPQTEAERLAKECAAVIRSYTELPKAVRNAAPSRVESRVLKRRLLRQLVSQPPPPNHAEGWSDRILRREESLAPHIGKVLRCVLIRLPGVQYTVEVDLQAGAVVHWEWQSN